MNRLPYRYLLLCVCGLVAASVRAANGEWQPLVSSRPKLFGVSMADAAGGLTPSTYLASASVWRLWHTEFIKTSGCDAGGRDNSKPRSRLSFGGGLRLTQTGGFGLISFDGRGSAAGQTAEIQSPQLTAFNVAAHVRWRLAGRFKHPLRIGFDIDLVGVSIGPSRLATTQPIGSGADSQPLRPVAGNALLGNTRDCGTLSSELYLSYKISLPLTVRAGLAHVAASYALDGNLYHDKGP